MIHLTAADQYMRKLAKGTFNSPARHANGSRAHCVQRGGHQWVGGSEAARREKGWRTQCGLVARAERSMGVACKGGAAVHLDPCEGLRHVQRATRKAAMQAMVKGK